jgi:hypothetical protein
VEAHHEPVSGSLRASCVKGLARLKSCGGRLGLTAISRAS